MAFSRYKADIDLNTALFHLKIVNSTCMSLCALKFAYCTKIIRNKSFELDK